MHNLWENLDVSKKKKLKMLTRRERKNYILKPGMSQNNLKQA